MTHEHFDGATRLRIRQCLEEYLDDPAIDDKENFIDKLEEFILIPPGLRETKA